MSEVLKLNMRGGPLNDQNGNTDKDYPATLSIDGSDDYRYIRMRFATPDGKGYRLYRTGFHSQHFAILAQLMMDADPEAAIRAFGKAMESAKLESRKGESDEAAA